MSSRRQYSSCDSCRQLKRRCVYEGTTRRSGLVCLRCKELGYNCTFDYISASLEQKKRKRRSTASNYKQSRSTELISIEEPVDTVDWNSVFQPFDGDVSTDFDDLNNNIVAEYLNLESLDEEWQDLTMAGCGQSPILDINNRSSDYALQANHQPKNLNYPGTGKQFERAQLFTCWKGSPTQLLNSTFTAKSLGTSLHHTYAAMMHGMESRYLEYECNPFGPTHRYKFDSEDASLVIENNRPLNELPGARRANLPTMSMLQSLSGLKQTHQEGPKQDTQLEDTMKITFVGLAKFLDHFGHFYGNRLDQRSKMEDERMLIATQQVFALQWAVEGSRGKYTSVSEFHRSEDSSTEDLHAFASSWFKARSLILNATPGHSFTRVYAMILFHTSVAPEEAKDVAGELNDILDRCLHEFEDLNSMVDEYIKLLSSTSTYRNLLQSSVKAFQWFAYIKDTFAALLTERNCILTENPMNLSATGLRLTPQPVDIIVDADVPLVCQRAVLLIYRILRQTAKVKQFVRDSESIAGSPQLDGILDSAIGFVEEFNHVYDDFRNRCMAEFHTLSSPSKLSFGYLVLFWSLGTLTLAEEIEKACGSHLLQGNNLREFVIGKGKRYEKDAISSVIAISQHVADMSAENSSLSVCGESEIKLPFISHHASLAPVVVVLTKSIDHMLQRVIGSENPDDGAHWMLSIKPVLTCLLDMKSTLAGSRSIQSPLSRLLTLHGDLLMECWTVDELDELLS